MYFNIRMILMKFDMLTWEVGYESWMDIELFLGVWFCKLQVWGCFIYKGDSAEFLIEFLDIINNIDSIIRV